ncbi:hypothetical protein [Candidatus Tisiphia endosymbiont of Sialis lutaria]|uniref:hypothetical protein n=1 Tax=Candidatus Tisiphia endosymbiont of Sialis lutaria TaxID=2029164 RepID=UPI00312C8B29
MSKKGKNNKRVTYNNNTPLNEVQKQDLQEILSTKLPPGFFEKNPEFGVKIIDGGRFNSPTGTVGLVLGGFVATVTADSLLNGISSANNPNAVSKIGHQSTLPNNIAPVVTHVANNPLSKEQSSKLSKLEQSISTEKRSVDNHDNYVKITKGSDTISLIRDKFNVEPIPVTTKEEPTHKTENKLLVMSTPIRQKTKDNQNSQFTQEENLLHTHMKQNLVDGVYRKAANKLNFNQYNFEPSFLKEQLLKNNVTTLSLDYNTIDPETAKLLGEILKETPITTLIIEHSLELAGIEDLINLMKGNKINTLILERNNIPSEVAKALVEAIKDNDIRIEKLDIRNNRIDTETAQWILDYLKGTEVTIDWETEDNLSEKEPTPESHTASKVETTPLLKALLGTFVGICVTGFVGFAAIMACLCTEDDNDTTTTDMPNYIPQGRVTIYTRKPLEARQQTLGNEEQNKYNPIYSMPSATKKPLPETPRIEDAVEDEIYDQCGEVNVYVIEAEPCNGVTIGNTTATGLQEESRNGVTIEMVRNTAINEPPYLDMTTATGVHLEIESDC